MNEFKDKEAKYIRDKSAEKEGMGYTSVSFEEFKKYLNDYYGGWKTFPSRRNSNIKQLIKRLEDWNLTYKS